MTKAPVPESLRPGSVVKRREFRERERDEALRRLAAEHVALVEASRLARENMDLAATMHEEIDAARPAPAPTGHRAENSPVIVLTEAGFKAEASPAPATPAARSEQS